MSYEIATKFVDKLEKLKFKVAIADEGHYMKSRDVSFFN